ncbi:MAG: DUF5074 domain-containing protein [Bacteroides sp.]|nr:DUF5074 domain-containing protein [Bacteroides sp.]MCM1378675.1 DUF5074 domain-containing protein [Bacteroides sp.]MCM1444948.1 DUF5074 domain-containing protein [Prevotella sp.]
MKKPLFLFGLMALVAMQVSASSPNAEKVRYTVDEGENFYTVVLNFNNPNRLDNLVLGYRTNATSIVASDLVEAIAAADRRMEVVAADGAITSVKFDLNGDDVLDDKDAVAENSNDASWNVTEADNVITLHYGENATCEYYFYLPGPDEQGVWVPEEMTIKLSDAGFVLPVLVQPQGGAVAMTTNWQASSSNTTYKFDSKFIGSPYTLIDGTYNARPTLKGATGTTYVRYRPQIDKVYTESNFMTLNIEDPEVPMTAIIFAQSSIESALNKVINVDFTFEPENATYTGVSFTSSNTKVATWSASAGLKSTTTAGEATITAKYIYNPEVTAEFALTTKLMKPVTAVNFGPGTEDGVINVPIRQLTGLKPVIEPEDADIPDVTITLSDNGTSRDDMTCSTYKVNWWDINNVRSQFFELSGHRPTGDTPAKISVVSTDGQFSKDFIVNVIEADRTSREQGYVDGTIILNEEWFTHTNGGLNYFTEEDEIIYQAYEKENPGMAFGATSQHGCIWNGMLIVASKQAADGGDPLPGGGRLVIADATTLKCLGSLENLAFTNSEGTTLSGDGRAVCGATADKIYVSTSNGIFVVNVADPTNPEITGRIGMGEGENSTDLYNGQIGDMVNACGHVFAVMQSTGLLIVDVDTDKLNDATIADKNVQGVTQSADGNVWYCTTGADENGNACSIFVALDPETLQEVDRVKMPAEVGVVACSWGAWRSTAFKGAYKGNNLWFVTGAAGIMGGATGDYYKYHIGDYPAEIKPFFTLKDKTGINAFGEEVGLMTYGTPIYDPRNDRLIVMAGRSGAASGGYRDHWTLYVDGQTGEVTKTFKLNPYYWFQSLPILPDKYDVEFNIDDIEFDFNDQAKEFDLEQLVSDPDNIRRNVTVCLVSEPSAQGEDAVAEPAIVKLENNLLTVTPQVPGQTSFTLCGESNGRAVSKTINVYVKEAQTGIQAVSAEKSMKLRGSRLFVNGYCGSSFTVYDLAGAEVAEFVADAENCIFDFGAHKGIYLVKSSDGSVLKVSVK